MLVSEFDFELPDERIATQPCEPRDACGLLAVNKFFFDFQFHQLPDLLKRGDLLIFNDSKVIPARLFGQRGEAKVEVLLHKLLRHAPTDSADNAESRWEVFLRPAKRIKEGQIIYFERGLEATLLTKHENGTADISFNQSGEKFLATLSHIGHMPLPPYIKRADSAADKKDYQTVYARDAGSVAAPTAGLHFTKKLMSRLSEKGIDHAFVTLHVGAGTFQPVKVEDTQDHVMHAEYALVPKETADAINATRARGGKIIAVGTTSLRILETVAAEDGTMRPFAGETDIFITPGYRFKVVDRLVTNFHLPKSTLFMLVCAFAGLQQMRLAYTYAIGARYRFYSYGDACLLDRQRQR